MSYLTDAPIDSRKLAESVTRPSDGACVVFEGVVRDNHQGKRVESIFYDAYRPMAEKEIQTIVDDIHTRFPQVAVAVIHRLGLLRVGEASIAIACASPHRGEEARRVFCQTDQARHVRRHQSGLLSRCGLRFDFDFMITTKGTKGTKPSAPSSPLW